MRTGICGNFYCGSPDYFLNCTANCSRLADPLTEGERHDLSIALPVGVSIVVLGSVCMAWGCIWFRRRCEMVDEMLRVDRMRWEAQGIAAEGVTFHEGYGEAVVAIPIKEGIPGEVDRVYQ